MIAMYLFKKRSIVRLVLNRFIILVVFLLLGNNKVIAQFSLYVGESEFLETPDPPYNGWIENANWVDRGSHIAISESDEYGAIVYPSHYFEGTESITCSYTFGYYSGNYKRAGHSQKTFYITCKEIPFSLDKTEVELTVGKSITLKPSYPSSYSGWTFGLKYEWSSNNDDIATVNNNGKITGVSPGRTTIKIDPIAGKEIYCYVTVVYIPPTSISFSDEKTSIVEGKSKTLKYALSPSGASASVKWKSSDENIVKVSSTGLITGITEGKATVTVTTDNNLSATCSIEVISAPKSVSLPSTCTVIQGYSQALKPVLVPSDSETTYKWKVEDANLATVSTDGTVKGKNFGTTKVTVTTDNGLSADCQIIVVEPTQGMDYRNAKVRVKAIESLINKTVNIIR